MPPGLRHHRREFSVAQGSRNGKCARHAPCHQQPARASNVTRHLRRNNENPRPNHGPDHHHDGIEQG